jgi:hypothetical protein
MQDLPQEIGRSRQPALNFISQQALGEKQVKK